jgi:hypothetical protein
MGEKWTTIAVARLFFVFDHASQAVPGTNSVTVGIVCRPSHRIIVSDCFSGRCVQSLAPARKLTDHSCQLPVLIPNKFHFVPP